MKVAIETVIDVGDTAYADVITYFIGQYGTDTVHTVEKPTDAHVPEAVENVVNDILINELREHDATIGWTVVSSFSTRS